MKVDAVGFRTTTSTVAGLPSAGSSTDVGRISRATPASSAAAGIAVTSSATKNAATLLTWHTLLMRAAGGGEKGPILQQKTIGIVTRRRVEGHANADLVPSEPIQPHRDSQDPAGIHEYSSVIRPVGSDSNHVDVRLGVDWPRCQ